MEVLPPPLSYPPTPHVIVLTALGHSLLPIFHCSIDEKTPYLALGAVKNISLNISISNLGDDAYDANVSFNVSRELFFINMWQKVRRYLLTFIMAWNLEGILQRLFLDVEDHLQLLGFFSSWTLKAC